jgi:thioredoxin reductase
MVAVTNLGLPSGVDDGRHGAEVRRGSACLCVLASMVNDTRGPDVDILVVGGGPAGLAAALWAGRYRRRVLLVENGEQRNRWTEATHGYLAADGVSPGQLLDRMRSDLSTYPQIELRRGATIESVVRSSGGFDAQLADGDLVTAQRIVLATGVRDVFPDIEGFEEMFGRSVFTCPSCDGYEARGRSVAVFGDDEQLADLAAGLLDWAASVTVISGVADDEHAEECRRLRDVGVRVVEGVAARLVGSGGRLQRIELADGTSVECEVSFCKIDHEQQSELAMELGCDVSEEGCVLVDDHCRTSVEHVYAAGDMTPGPHLVQVAASKGAIAGVAAALSMQGHHGVGSSPRPAPTLDAARP